jgi:quinol monooxygenase YgiN
MIILVLKLMVSPSDRKDVISIFDTVAGLTSVKPGCKMVKLESDIHDDDLILIEEWETMSELEQYIASDEFRKIMAIMDIAVEPPEISFHSVSSTMGFELVEKIRENVNGLKYL